MSDNKRRRVGGSGQLVLELPSLFPICYIVHQSGIDIATCIESTTIMECQPMTFKMTLYVLQQTYANHLLRSA